MKKKLEYDPDFAYEMAQERAEEDWQKDYIEFNLNGRTKRVNRKIEGNMKFIINLWAYKPDYNEVEVKFYQWKNKIIKHS